MLATRSLDRIGDLELLFRLQLLIVCSIEEGAEEAAINGALIKHDRILLIITCVSSNSNDRVATSSKLLEA